MQWSFNSLIAHQR